MGDAERLAFNDPHSNSEAAGAMEKSQWVPASSPHTPSHVTQCVLGLPMEVVVEVHIKESNLDDL